MKVIPLFVLPFLLISCQEDNSQSKKAPTRKQETYTESANDAYEAAAAAAAVAAAREVEMLSIQSIPTKETNEHIEKHQDMKPMSPEVQERLDNLIRTATGTS